MASHHPSLTLTLEPRIVPMDQLPGQAEVLRLSLEALADFIAGVFDACDWEHSRTSEFSPDCLARSDGHEIFLVATFDLHAQDSQTVEELSLQAALWLAPAGSSSSQRASLELKLTTAPAKHSRDDAPLLLYPPQQSNVLDTVSFYLAKHGNQPLPGLEAIS
jgi:hypothetical protein